jgi:hypothetical protein
MTQTASDRGPVLRRLHDRGDGLVSGRALSATKIDLTIRGESVAKITISAGVGGRWMACDQMSGKSGLASHVCVY